MVKQSEFIVFSHLPFALHWWSSTNCESEECGFLPFSQLCFCFGFWLSVGVTFKYFYQSHDLSWSKHTRIDLLISNLHFSCLSLTLRFTESIWADMRFLAKSYQSLIIKLLTEHYLKFLSLKWGYTGFSESTLFKMAHCWISDVAAYEFHSNGELSALSRDKLVPDNQVVTCTVAESFV